MALVAWSSLPSELVAKIADHLPSRTDKLRLRSVCSAWRAALRHHPNHLHQRPNYGVIPNSNGFDPICPADTNILLITRTIFLLSPVNPNPNSIPWLIKTEEIHDGKFRLVHPFSRYPIERLPSSVPKVINFSDIKILELGHEYILYFDSHDPSRRFYREKVAYLATGNDDDYVLLTINMFTKLAMFRSIDKQWKIIDYMEWSFNDVISFNGMFYAVDYRGRTVTVSPDSGDVMVVVNEPVSYYKDGKHLVQMGNELILVDMHHIITDPLTESEEEEESQDDVAYCSVFKLDIDGNKWDEIEDFGDRVLFLGSNCTFSASLSDLKWYDSKGNYVCCSSMEDLDWLPVKNFKFACQSIKAYDMKAKTDCYRNNRYCSKLLWRIPSWITSIT